jgi:hypothetical protein
MGRDPKARETVSRPGFRGHSLGGDGFLAGGCHRAAMSPFFAGLGRERNDLRPRSPMSRDPKTGRIVATLEPGGHDFIVLGAVSR